MTAREMGPWLRHYFPDIRPSSGWGGDPCWIAFMMTRDPEHNPPFYWLGRALDAVADGGDGDLFRARLLAAHGPQPCLGHPSRDDDAQDVLSEATAYAWTAANIGAPVVEPAHEGSSLESGPIRLHVPEHSAYVAPERLRPRRTLQDVMQAIGSHAEAASHRLPHAPGRILYLDTWHEQSYAQSVGYRLELTEPLQQALRHFAAEFGLGHVLTRPFQWGNPVEAWY